MIELRQSNERDRRARLDVVRVVLLAIGGRRISAHPLSGATVPAVLATTPCDAMTRTCRRVIEYTVPARR